MTEKIETQLIPAIPVAETASPQGSVEAEVGDSGIRVDLHAITEPRQDSEPTSPSNISSESGTIQPTTHNTVHTTGDAWSEVISEKRRGFPPRVL